jgi:hypothetical protein
MSEQQDAWTPPPEWQGDIEIEVRASGETQTLSLRDATRDDWIGVQAALNEAARRHDYRRAERQREMRNRESQKRFAKLRGPGALDPDDEPEPGHTGASTGHS